MWKLVHILSYTSCVLHNFTMTTQISLMVLKVIHAAGISNQVKQVSPQKETHKGVLCPFIAEVNI